LNRKVLHLIDSKINAKISDGKGYKADWPYFFFFQYISEDIRRKIKRESKSCFWKKSHTYGFKTIIKIGEIGAGPLGLIIGLLGTGHTKLFLIKTLSHFFMP